MEAIDKEEGKTEISNSVFPTYRITPTLTEKKYPTSTYYSFFLFFLHCVGISRRRRRFNLCMAIIPFSLSHPRSGGGESDSRLSDGGGGGGGGREIEEHLTPEPRLAFAKTEKKDSAFAKELHFSLHTFLADPTLEGESPSTTREVTCDRGDVRKRRNLLSDVNFVPYLFPHDYLHWLPLQDGSFF